MNKVDSTRVPVIVLGAGGHAKVLIEALRLIGTPIKGVTDPAAKRKARFLGLPLLGGDERVVEYATDELQLVNGLGPLPGKPSRWKLAEHFRNLGYRFSSVIHPRAIIADDVALAEGVQVMAGAVIQPGVKVGVDTIINTGALIDHDCRIGSGCHIAPGATLCGSVVVGDNTHIGTGATVIQNITIKHDCIIGAGSVVLNNIQEGVKLVQCREEKVTRGLSGE